MTFDAKNISNQFTSINKNNNPNMNPSLNTVNEQNSIVKNKSGISPIISNISATSNYR